MGDLFWDRLWWAAQALATGSTVTVQDVDLKDIGMKMFLEEINIRVHDRIGFNTSRKVYATRTDRGVYRLKLSR